MALQDSPEIPADRGTMVLKPGERIAYIPALVSGVIGVGLIRSGVLSFLFLVPLGVMAYRYNPKSAWLSVLTAILGNGIFAVGLALTSSGASLPPWLEAGYFAVIMIVFTWIVAPPFREIGFLRLSIGYRFIIASVIGAFAFLGIIETARYSFDAFLRSQGEMLSALYIASAGTDVVQQSLMEDYLTPEHIINLIGFVMLRGGGVVSWVLIFFINRHLSQMFSWVVYHIRVGDSIGRFHVASGLIWVLSCSLLGVLLGKWTGIPLLEILAWNMLTICGILYLAQGGGIVWHFLSQKVQSPFMRLALTVLIILLIITPGINLGALGLTLLLGIAEHWVPFRAPQSNGPSSTPGM
jgi:hypothetical protein